MIRIILLFIVFVKGKDAISQHTFITRVENTSLVQWAENRLKVLVEGRMCGEIVVKASRGQILMDANNCEIIYTAPDTSIRRTIIKIGVKQKNEVSWLQEMELPVLGIPDPIPTVGGYPSGASIPAAGFISHSGITVPVADGWHMVQVKSKQHITRYSVNISRKDSIIFSLSNINGFLFPQELPDFITSFVMQGDEIRFFDIDTLIYGQERRHLNDTYKLTFR